MSNTTLSHQSPAHVALFPSAGFGHLSPFLRLAAKLASHNNCIVTLITAQPTVSAAESAHITTFLTSHPHINQLHFQILPYTPPNPATADPFFVQWEAISRSAHLLHPLLSALSPPLSAIVSDITVVAGIGQIVDDLSVPYYILCPSSARMLSLLVYAPLLLSQGSVKSNDSYVDIPGTTPMPMSLIPPPLFIPDHPFASVLVASAPYFSKASGILLNTFNWIDPESIAALNAGKVVPNLPQVLPVGPLEPEFVGADDERIPWLDEQPNESVVYVNFGSRVAMSEDQIRELGNGLERSGHRFLWVLKTSTVDKEDKGELEDLLGDSFIENTKSRGKVVKGWVNQDMILGHPAIGVFLSHCGWNSIVEAAIVGIPILAYPQIGDHKVNAGVAEKAGLAFWDEDWGWLGEKVVTGEEIAKKVQVIMGDENLKAKARKVGEEARKAIQVGGSSENTLMNLIGELKPKEK